ncbi:MAG: hypothetical protein RL154_1084, partial [Pseudomonadota bacterium]
MFQQLDEFVLYKEILRHLNEIVLVINEKTGAVEFLNDVAQSVLGYSQDDFKKLGSSWFRCPLGDNEVYSLYIKELRRKDDRSDKNEYAVMKRKDGLELLVEANIGHFRSKGVQYDIIFAKDVTEKLEYTRKLYTRNQELQKSIISREDELKMNISRLQSYEQALDVSSIVSITDIKGKITYVNKRFEEISGYTADEAVGESHSIVRHPSVPKETFRDMWHTLKEKKVWRG